MSHFEIAAALVVLAAGFGLVNYHFLKFPATIGLLVVSLVASILLILFDLAIPSIEFVSDIQAGLKEINFHDTVMQGMLGFLLFAGAIHVDLEGLKRRKWAIGLMASLGLLISTGIVGLGFSWIAGVPLIVALVFGALISPTDPVAVLGILKNVQVPASLEAKIAGESLFNDGVAVVVFLILVAIAFPAPGADEVDALDVIKLFVIEAVGGAVLGGVAGWITYRAIATVDEYNLEVILTLALAMGAYSLAAAIHVSGPIAVVVAGLFIGNHGMAHGMSPATRGHVQTFWHLIDEILNAVLFLLIGIEVFAISFGEHSVAVALATIPLILVARLVAVGVPISLLSLRSEFSKGAIPILTWGGLRGGISIALVLSLPANEWSPVLLTATYAVVIFSIIVQGLTVSRVVKKFI